MDDDRANDPVPPEERDGPPAHAPGQGRTSNVHFSHVTTGRWLPPPGKTPGWPFAEIGHWQVDAQAAAEDWRIGLHEWRREHRSRLGWDDTAYRRPELQWAQRNIVHVQMMVEDRYFYDPDSGRYTVDRYLDEVRPKHVVPPDAGVIFLTEQGERLSLGHVTELMRDYIDAQAGGPGKGFLKIVTKLTQLWHRTREDKI